jgi:hypothetical protein
MSRKDYNLCAETIAKSNLPMELKLQIAEDFAYSFQRNYQNFNVDRFMEFVEKNGKNDLSL